MSIFNLPDLGEGLPDAEIVEWHVKEGDTVKADAVLVSMETAKAVVDVPAPQSGIIVKLYGQAGDIINTGSPLLEFAETSAAVGNVKAVQEVTALVEESLESGVTHQPEVVMTEPFGDPKRVKAMPSVRALASKLGVNLANITPSGPKDRVTSSDVKNAAAATKRVGPDTLTSVQKTIEPLRGVRRAMANAMVKSHSEVVPVTLVDDADIHAWLPGSDITWRVIRAITSACKTEPALNAHFEMAKLERTLFPEINIGIAMDAGEGLFVPVLKNAEKHDQASFRQELNRFKAEVQARSISPKDLGGSTIQLSNFGTFAGRYANPIVVPPNVAIIGTGKFRDEVVAVNNAIAIHRVMPLSITVDHRAITGGEAARFLKAMIDDLQKSQ